MATFSGKDGKIKVGATTLADITRWSLSTTAHNASYASSATAGFKRRVAGVKEGSGRIMFKLDAADPLTDDFQEGSSVTLLLYVDATHFYSLPALIPTLTLDVDIASGDVVGGTAEFSTSGAWTLPTYS